MADQTQTEKTIEEYWAMFHEGLRGVRKHLAKEGATLRMDMVIRDKAASEQYAKRKKQAAARKKRKYAPAWSGDAPGSEVT